MSTTLAALASLDPPVGGFLACAAALMALTIGAVAAARRPWASSAVYGIALVLSLAAGVAAAWRLVGDAPVSSVVLPIGLPWIGAHFRIDALSALFLAVVNLGGAAASLYALGYGRHEPAPGRVLPFYPAFLAGMNLVVLADDAFTFLVSWELMSLASWALVIVQHRDPSNRRAGYVYLLMASFGALCLLLAFGLLAGPQGGYAFDAIRQHPPSAGLAALVLALAVLGAGSKAGLVPLHVWLPLAHPAAPSHVSGLMSGVMTKVAVYAFLRIVLDLLGPPAWWWSLVVLTLGAASAGLGVLYALMQTDLKRSLAYSTIENIGFIFVGIGLGLAFRSAGQPAAAALAFTAALFHVVNHALFKSALFFGAGAVQTATGERDMERLGGLIRTMPQVAFAVLAACVAAAALPPLNGFVSEWMLLQAILLSPRLPQWALKMLTPAAGAVLAFSAVLASTLFVRLFGISFLGRPRTEAAAHAHEADRWSRAALFLLVALCLLAGVLPGFVIDALGPAARALAGARMPAQAGLPWLSIAPIAESRSSYNGLLVFLFIAVSASVSAYAIHRLASRAWRRGPAWDCGFPGLGPEVQYTATSFAQPIRRIFGSMVFGAREQVDMPAPGETRPATLKVIVRDPIWETVYGPIGVAVGYAADKLNRLQYLTIRRYLMLVFLALVGLLLVLAIWL